MSKPAKSTKSNMVSSVIVRHVIYAAVVGVISTFIVGMLYKSSGPNIDSAKQYSIVCAVVGANIITETSYGFPLTYLKTFDNSCYSFPNEWQPTGLIVDVAVFSLAAGGLLHLVWRKK